MQLREAYFKLRALYDLLFYDSAVEGSYWRYFRSRFNNVLSYRGRIKPRSGPPGKALIKNRLGVFEVDVSNDTVAKISPYFEHWLQSWILEGGDILIDVGANIGFYSILATRHRGYSKAFAFEPNPAIHSMLSTNIRLNALEGIVIAENVALGNANDPLLLKVERVWTGTSRIITRKRTTEEGLIRVPQTTLDSYIDQNGIDVSRIDHVKIDIEGFEYFALEGAVRTLRGMKSGARVQVEVWRRNPHREGVFGLLTDLDFVEGESFGDDYLFHKR